MPEQSNDYRVAVFGAGGVGKSSLVLRFVRGTFRETYIPTIEDTYRQVISCNKNVCTLQITDTTGSHQFPAMQRLSISKGHAFILVYSITSRQSLEELKPIYDIICETKGDVDNIPVMLVGNKCDDPNREVSIQQGMEQAKAWNCAFLETSAKTNYNVKELFQDLLQLEKRRTMSLHLETKKTKSQKRREKLKGKCSIMWEKNITSPKIDLKQKMRVFCKEVLRQKQEQQKLCKFGGKAEVRALDWNYGWCLRTLKEASFGTVFVKSYDCWETERQKLFEKRLMAERGLLCLLCAKGLRYRNLQFVGPFFEKYKGNCTPETKEKTTSFARNMLF